MCTVKKSKETNGQEERKTKLAVEPDRMFFSMGVFLSMGQRKVVKVKRRWPNWETKAIEKTVKRLLFLLRLGRRAWPCTRWLHEDPRLELLWDQKPHDAMRGEDFYMTARDFHVGV